MEHQLWAYVRKLKEQKMQRRKAEMQQRKAKLYFFISVEQKGKSAKDVIINKTQMRTVTA